MCKCYLFLVEFALTKLRELITVFRHVKDVKYDLFDFSFVQREKKTKVEHLFQGFFKRSILRKEKYRCYFGDKCIIDSHNRNRCKSCRFQKCLNEGMSVEGVKMGRIPKLVKEKALAECISSSVENDDPTEISSNDCRQMHKTSTTTLLDFSLPIIDEHSLFADLDAVPIDSQLNCHTPPPFPTTITLSNYHTYELPANFTIDETKQEIDDDRIVQLNPSALSHYMPNCDEHFATNVIERMKVIVQKISHPTSTTQLDYEESSFIRYLRWKMFDLSNTYNGRTRQLVERMHSMIRLKVDDYPGKSSSLQDVWAGLTGRVKNQMNKFRVISIRFVQMQYHFM